ncbi:MAG TPA: Wzz/FepE/Etk N-terminal domain-containing protein, partial [Casimicrobiaceae bacterium]
MTASPPSVRPDLAPSDPYTAQINVMQYFQSVWQHRWPIVLAAILCGGIAAAVSWLTPATYVATARLQVGGVPSTSVASETMDSYQRACEDPDVARDAVADAGLDKPPLNMTAAAFTSNALTIERLDGEHAFLVEVTLRDQKLASLAAASVARHAIALSQERSKTVDVNAFQQLRLNLKEAQNRFDVAAAALQGFQTKTGLDWMAARNAGLDALQQSIPGLEADIQAESARIQAAQLLLTKTPRTLKLSTSGDVAPNRVFDSLQEEINSSRAKVAALQARKAYALSSQRQGRVRLSDEDEQRLQQLQTQVSTAQAVRDRVADTYKQALLASGLPKPTLELAGQHVALADTIGSHPARNAAAGLALGFFLAAMTLLGVHVVH